MLLRPPQAPCTPNCTSTHQCTMCLVTVTPADSSARASTLLCRNSLKIWARSLPPIIPKSALFSARSLLYLSLPEVCYLVGWRNRDPGRARLAMWRFPEENQRGLGQSSPKHSPEDQGSAGPSPCSWPGFGLFKGLAVGGREVPWDRVQEHKFRYGQKGKWGGWRFEKTDLWVRSVICAN